MVVSTSDLALITGSTLFFSTTSKKNKNINRPAHPKPLTPNPEP
jgi:hypothetical protein